MIKALIYWVIGISFVILGCIALNKVTSMSSLEKQTRNTPSYKAIAEQLQGEVIVLQHELAVLKGKGNFEDYQAFVKSSQLPQSTNTVYLGCGLGGESGEVLGLIAKAQRDGIAGLQHLQTNMPKELGDVLWFVGAIADFYGLKLADIAQGNVDKIKSRMARGTLGGNGDNR